MLTIRQVAAAARPAGRRRRLALLGCAVTVPLMLAACGGGRGKADADGLLSPGHAVGCGVRLTEPGRLRGH